MSAAALPDTQWGQFRRAIQARRAGTSLTVDDIRTELETAQIRPAAYGALFRHAVHVGLLTTSGFTVPSTDPNARRRRVLQYHVLAEDPWAEAS